VYRVTPHPPLNAFEQAGWRLTWSETPNWYQSLRERTSKQTDESFTIGAWVKQDGTIADVVFGSPAYAAGLMPGMKITSVNGRKYGADELREEIAAKRALDVNVEQGTFSGAFHVDYRDGEHYPHLERTAGADLLTDIMRARGERPSRPQ
jgi:predicted metalloprotease with PDZ domain